MVKRIKWSAHAVADRIQIFDYWHQQIGNKTYSKKLGNSLKEIILKLVEFQKLGRKLNNQNVRFFVKERYQIFYLDNIT